MTPRTRTMLHVVVTLLGLLLIIGGIYTGKYGGVIIGIIVSGVNAQAWLRRRG